MNMPTTFILAPESSLAPSPSLNLLPFSLGSIPKPYSSLSAPISTYFRPRPAPVGIPGVEPGTPIAAFRGRQLAGQSVPVPRGYRGIIITADKPEIVNYSSNVEDGQEGRKGGRNRQTRWPLTPAPSTEESGSSSTLLDDGTEMTRGSPRKNGFQRLKSRVIGAGQTALARPKRVAAVKQNKKRYRLDSDDEDDDGGIESIAGPSHTQVKTPEVKIEIETNTIEISEPSTNPPLATPSKRSRPTALSTPTRQSPRLSQPKTPAPNPGLPYITLQEATPLKSPLPAPPSYLKRKRGRADYVIPGSPSKTVTEVEDEEEMLVRTANDDSDDNYGRSDKTKKQQISESDIIIPSPSTENDPPTFSIPSPAPSESINTKEDHTNHPKKDAIVQEIRSSMGIDGPMRVLQPVSTFDSITLWTPDGPLAGYKSTKDESLSSPVNRESAIKAVSSNTGETEPSKEEVKLEEDGVKVRQSWWPQGGSGEGGDEVVRAMGEWLGMVELLNKPVYLEHYSDDDDEDDEL